MLRAAHALCAALLLGAAAYAQDPASLRAAWHATIVSGALLLVLDLHETAVFLLQVRGLLVVVKLGVVAAVPWLGRAQAAVLGALFVMSVLSSHAPARVRYRVLFGGADLRGGTSKG